MHDLPHHFLADLLLHPAQPGSKATALVSGQWCAILCIDQQQWSARLTFTGSPAPGVTFRAGVQLLMPDALAHFPAGADFTLWANGSEGTGHVVLRAA
ncbi:MULTISPECIES: hypothetical protein [Xanthomonas]|uniref:Uncharacterized protein n=1 Tax=Xanthomonas sacchari TaxID=56458 RepID=A0AA46Y9D5_9XANT|nr:MULTISPECIES: hypothetical protein [Xanthomonas]KAB7762050.1 hypothetical protein CEK68_19560 [Xanthomonas sp. LMG 12461]MCW0368391.1 hypothetical protein [Xanthomonas sacchari]MCW0392186.1 hypothetical protein [Xanthomonas sacchari]MCW0396671.1 hypothetical protein [Xanthomonas sacchari]MCW0441808.1 hypothetical protein [Xanthomonas sacchari]